MTCLLLKLAKVNNVKEIHIPLEKDYNYCQKSFLAYQWLELNTECLKLAKVENSRIDLELYEPPQEKAAPLFGFAFQLLQPISNIYKM